MFFYSADVTPLFKMSADSRMAPLATRLFYIPASLRDVTGLTKLSFLNAVDGASTPISGRSFQNFRKHRTENFVLTFFYKEDLGVTAA
jgi:hypothetical protein